MGGVLFMSVALVVLALSFIFVSSPVQVILALFAALVLVAIAESLDC